MTVLAISTKVRLVNDPGRNGTIIGAPRQRAGTNYYRIQFRDGSSSHPEYELEVVTEQETDPFALLEQGRYGRITDLRRRLTHIQLSGRLANLVYSMDATNIDFYAYQYKPVLSFLESPSQGLLIADEVGLGKTIEAGLIWTELRLRYDARRLVVVCPAMLREKWKVELERRFAVQAEIMDAQQFFSELQRNKGDIADGKAIICSMQGLRPPRTLNDRDSYRRKVNPRQQLADFLQKNSDAEPLIDLLIIDEAHHLRNPASQTSHLGHLLRDVADHIVLLSATPINLHSDDLYQLLHLIDPDTFYNRYLFPNVLKANEPLLKAQLATRNINSTEAEIKIQLAKAASTGLLRGNRQLQSLLNEDLTQALSSRSERIALVNRIERINLLRHVLTRTRKTDVVEWRVMRRAKTLDVELTPIEEDFYSQVTEAIRDYAACMGLSDGFLLVSPQRQVSSCMAAAVEAWQSRSDLSIDAQLYEDLGLERNQGEDTAPLMRYLADNVLPEVDIYELRENDSKYEKFRAAVVNYLEQHPSEKIIVFSFFRGTLRYLLQRLADDNIHSEILMGGMREPKQSIIDRFQDDPNIRVLLASEVACEGVDLQFCRVLFNYDLPWNPTRVEQRIGRIDRLGQSAEVISIVNFCYAGTIDQRIHDRLLMRLNIFEKALGGMEAILGEKISDLVSELLVNKLSSQEEAECIEQTAMAIEAIKQEQEQLEGQAGSLIAHSGFILEKVHAAREFNKRINERDLLVYVKDYLESHWQGFDFLQLDGDSLQFDIRLPAELVAKLRDFIRAKKLFGQTRLAEGTKVSCQFVNKVGSLGSRTESISQFHPLIRFISEDLKERDNVYCPLVAVRLKHKCCVSLGIGIYAFCLHRWNFSGLREEEQLHARVVKVGGGNMLNPDESWGLVGTARSDGEDWLAVANEVDSHLVAQTLDNCAVALQDDFERALSQKKNENYDRVTFQVHSAEKQLERELSSQERTIETHKTKQNTRMIPLVEAKIKKIKERFEVQCAGFKRKENLRGSNFDVSCGVICLVK